ncbi:exodeoxyribonuclease V subunit beta [Oceanisphaera avium]|uniref:RecBCD enzyme subunit RecB n=1 Tax=Oceanisphaera avium TaxID=1903694 RepID=A0A1Y0CV54_9GAMM|nr:exodeoxyribonuclease V subunit beta [Oceanisphaera avium]ART79220.1 exodeoxyribonuclease V subunit beta [Oceanisphaera avium]
MTDLLSRPLALRFPLYGSRLIEASAGTGKTFTISALYLRLILGHGNQAAFGRELLPPEILVVTFTDAATRELRDRIRARLVEAARVFRDELVGDALLAAFKADFEPARWLACAQRLDIAAQWMDEAAVSTIHSWCQRMLREHAFDSGSLFTQTLQTDHSELKAQVVRDYWRLHCYPLTGSALEWVISHWQSPSQLLSAIQPLLRQPSAQAQPKEPLVPLSELLEQLLQQRAQKLAKLKAPWSVWLDEIARLLHSGIANKQVHGKWLQAKRTDTWLAGIKDWRDSEAIILELTDAAWQRLTPAGLSEAWKVGEAPAHPAFEALETLREQLACLNAPLDPARLHAATWVSQRFQEEKRRRAEMGFDDMLTRLDQALHGENGERLSAVIRNQFPVAMIDEFQDTDPQQYRIFDRIYGLSAASNTGASERSDRGLFLIGDPKQAIYAFRGADIHTYLAARLATKGRHDSLDTNFRSSQDMVNSVNRLFLAAEQRPAPAPYGAFLFGSEEDNPLPFTPVKAKGRAEQWCLKSAPDSPWQRQPALTLWHAEQSEPLTASAYRQQMALSCASHITHLLNLGQKNCAGFIKDETVLALKPSDIAVLVRNVTEAQAIRLALSERGVQSVYLSDKDSIFDSQEARDLVLWLRACAEPEQDRLLRSALASRTLGQSLYELELLNQDEWHWERCVLQFRDYQYQWRRQGVLPMLRQLLHDFDLPSRLVQHSEGERALTNILHLAELLQQAATNLDGEQALIRYLSERVQGDEPAGDEQVLRLESDAALVRVVTIHKSKGLEYPLVFLPFICAHRETKSNEAVNVHDGKQTQLILTPNDQQLQLAEQARLREDLRLLYVALTRSRHGCWLGLADIKNRAKGSVLHKSAIGQLLGGGEVLHHSAELAQWLAPLLTDNPSEIAITALPQPCEQRLLNLASGKALPHWREPRRRAAEHWWISSYSALRTGALTTPKTRFEDMSPEDAMAASGIDDDQETTQPIVSQPWTGASLHDFPRGPNPGTFLHGLLELAAAEGFAYEAGGLSEQIARRCALRKLEQWTPHLQAWLSALLLTPLAGVKLNGVELCLGELTTFQAEMEFWLEASHVDVQQMDRLVQQHVLPGYTGAPLLSDTLNGMFKGFIDLVLEVDGRYFVVDYKSNWLGADHESYTESAMKEQLIKHRYDLQYVLYILALHRQLKLRLAHYDYDQHVGGAIYWFIRHPQAQYVSCPPKELIESLDALFNNQYQPLPAPYLAAEDNINE